MTEPIKKDMKIGDIVSKYPEAAIVLSAHGLHCIGCHVSQYETLEEGCLAHGISNEDIDKMINELNEYLSKRDQVI
ncbi:DUF1858 domain-containing protein [Candidatus Aenigmatarchaeota archaeon]